MKYCVKIVMPDNYVHTKCFEEVALGLESGLKELNAYDSGGRPIVLGAHVVETLPENAIIFNLEQISQDSNWMTQRYLQLLLNHRVWDYSYNNIAELEKLGVKAKYCGIGYAPELTRIPKAENLDIDVGFYGSLNDRRMKILRELSNHCKVATIPGYGEQRDKAIARCKIILNCHYYEAKVFELVRCSYLMANSKCIVSEQGLDYELEYPFRLGLQFALYEGLVETCKTVLNNNMWEAIGKQGFELFSKLRQSTYLKDVLCA